MISVLDPGDPAQVAEYERAFYRVFRANTANRLIRSLWDWDEAAGRIRTRIDYGDQTILVERGPEGELVRALAIGTSPASRQSAAYGFDIPDDPASCEALTFFVTRERGLGETIPFWNACRERLMASGRMDLYGTCAPILWPLYKWVGGRRLETREIEGETRVFFVVDLARSRR